MPVQEDAQFGQIVVKGADVAQVDGVLMKDIGHHVPDEGGREALMRALREAISGHRPRGLGQHHIQPSRRNRSIVSEGRELAQMLGLQPVESLFMNRHHEACHRAPAAAARALASARRVGRERERRRGRVRIARVRRVRD